MYEFEEYVCLAFLVLFTCMKNIQNYYKEKIRKRLIICFKEAYLTKCIILGKVVKNRIWKEYYCTHRQKLVR